MAVDMSGLEAAVRTYAAEKIVILAEQFVEQARVFAPYRTGDLSKSIEAEDSATDTGSSYQIIVNVGAEYGLYQEEGTGIYGPQGVPITPVNGNVLVFDWPAAGGIVFARSVSGTEPTHWWTRALQAWPEVVAAAL